MGKFSLSHSDIISEPTRSQPATTPEPTIVYITNTVEKIVEVPVEKIVEVKTTVVEYVDREVEVIKTVIQEVEKQVIKEVEKFVERPYEVVRLQFQHVKHYPLWMLGVMFSEAVVIAALLLRK